MRDKEAQSSELFLQPAALFFYLTALFSQRTEINSGFRGDICPKIRNFASKLQIAHRKQETTIIFFHV